MTLRRLFFWTLLLIFVVGCGDDTSHQQPTDVAVDSDAPPLEDTAAPPDTTPPDPDVAPDIADADATLDATDTRDIGPDILDATDADADVVIGPVYFLRINELMPDNEGAWLDDAAETEDWIELVNVGVDVIDLGDYRIGDDPGDMEALPQIALGPGERVVLFADRQTEQGTLHLPFGLSAGGEGVYLYTADGDLVDAVEFGPARPNDSFARFPDGDGDWSWCRYASPARANGDLCEPLPPADLPTVEVFLPYDWPDPWPEASSPLSISELAINPAGFVEVLNVSGAPVDLTAYSLRIAPHGPNMPWPGLAEGVELTPGAPTLAAGGFAIYAVAASDVAGLGPDFEGVVTLLDATSGEVIDRVDFMSWPADAALTRVPSADGRHRFCADASPGADNTCSAPLASRPVGDRLRHLRTPGDYSALAVGGTALGIAVVKFVVDMNNEDMTYLLSSEAYDLHYTFVREEYYGQAQLDRCDPTENTIFRQGWYQFSVDEYYCAQTSPPADYECVPADNRRFLMGTFLKYTSSGLQTIEMSTGDRLSSEMMRVGFFAGTARVDDPTAWAFRAIGDIQVAKLRVVEGLLPIVDENAPFQGQTRQSLNEGEGYGVLTFVPAGDLESTPLSFQNIVITDQVPNDIALVGGLITESFQTPLAHVNILSRNRGTPNMALLDARSHPDIAPLIGELVRLDVHSAGFDIRAATTAEAEAFWAAQQSGGDPLTPSQDTTLRGVQRLEDLTLSALPAVGAKAAQLAEVMDVNWNNITCYGASEPNPVVLPADAFAIPIVHYLEHFDASGARALLEDLEANDPTFRTDPAYRAQRLADVRALIVNHPVDPALRSELEVYVFTHFRYVPVRFRSSSNTEDLPQFSGAGLYLSTSGTLNDPDDSIEDALRAVWASLWFARAYDERAYFNVDQSLVAMGILGHAATLSEEANGIGISRNILDPIRSDIYYFNVQKGEASVANPAPGIDSEQLLYRWGRNPPILIHAFSTFSPEESILDGAEVCQVARALRDIHWRFRPQLDPLSENLWFAMDIEFKLLDGSRELHIKQARPYSFGNAQVPADCRGI